MSLAQVSEPRSAEKPVLAVDLDGTLIRCDLFIEALLRLLFTKPWLLLAALGWFARGRAAAKAELAKLFPCEPETLPYDERLVDWLRAERAAGRKIVLATASDQADARRIADHLGLFDAVFASDGVANLKSRRKAEALAAAYPAGFAYAGNEAADLKVWPAAASAVLVNAPKGLARRARAKFEVEAEFAPTTSTLRALIKGVRPQQWAKNVLVFLALLVSQGWTDLNAWTQALIAFWALSFTASSVYLINDASDIESDRRHPRKRRRPFASGALSPAVGLPAALALLAIGLTLSTFANVAPLVLVYLAATTLYTFWVKRVLLVDVFMLACLYTIRVLIGGVATGHLASEWLLAFSSFFFLSLALVKRVAEVQAMQADGKERLSGRAYRSSDGDILKMLGVGAGFASALVLALYLQDDAVTARYQEPFMLWGLPAGIIFWLCRVWIKTDRGQMHDDPLVFAFRDRASWAAIAITGAFFAAAALMPPGLLPV